MTDRRPSVRHHYRAEKLALWLDLIPKIDREDGSERGSHQLDHSDNSSTFDDYQKLLSPNLDNTIFPSPPPMPPVRPTPSDRGGAPEGGWTTQGKGHHHAGVTDQDGGQSVGRPGGGRRDQPGGDNSKPSRHSGSSKNAGGNAVATLDVHGAGANDVTSDPASGDGRAAGSGKAASSAVPLSMVVAIGGSLLLINLLIFAGLCYQRERIRKMRRLDKPVLPPPELDYDEEDHGASGGGLGSANHHSSHKMLAGTATASAQESPTAGARRANTGLASAGGGPECMSLISTGGSSSGGGHQHQHRGPSPHRSNGYHQHGSTHVHNPSPQPFGDDIKEMGGGSGGPSRRSMPYMSRVTPPPLASIDSTGSSAMGGGGGGGGSFVPITSGGYSTVPTHASSPVHRTHPSMLPPSYMDSGGSGSPGKGGDRTVMGGSGLSGTGTYVNSQIHAAPISDVIVNHKPADIHSRVVPTGGMGPHTSGSGIGGARTGLPMTTFGVGAGSGLANQGRSGGGGSFSDRGSPVIVGGSSGDPGTGAISSSSSGGNATSGTDPVYKKINKSGQNNAVTIV